MDAYHIITTEDVRYKEVIDPDLGGPVDYIEIGDIVFAESRGKARAIFCRHYELEFDWKLSITKIADDVPRSAGVAHYNDAMWDLVDPLPTGTERLLFGCPIEE